MVRQAISSGQNAVYPETMTLNMTLLGEKTKL